MAQLGASAASANSGGAQTDLDGTGAEPPQLPSRIENIHFSQQLIHEIASATLDGDRLEADTLEFRKGAKQLGVPGVWRQANVFQSLCFGERREVGEQLATI